jgi:hypothetical protein
MRVLKACIEQSNMWHFRGDIAKMMDWEIEVTVEKKEL